MDEGQLMNTFKTSNNAKHFIFISNIIDQTSGFAGDIHGLRVQLRS